MQVLLPLKEFAAAKQRLSGVLSAAERAQLFAAMVEDVLQTLLQHPAIDRIAICSREQAARWLANYYDVEFIDERALHADDLNRAVNAAAKQIFARGEQNLLVVHGDLPLLRADDLTEFLQAHLRHSPAAALTIAPDRRGDGSNLLAWRALPQFAVSYGERSFQRHCAQACALGIEPVICDLPGARCDIDEPDDVLMLLQRTAASGASRSLAYLRSSGVAARLLAVHSGARNTFAGENRERG